MSRTRKPPASVALWIETSNAYGRGLLHGIVRFIRELQPRWSITFAEQGRPDRPPQWLSQWHGDGIIARIETQEIADAVRRCGLPVVDVSAARHAPGIPWVETDDVAIARIAADHLLERGFRTFGFCGNSNFNWSNWRRAAFVEYLAQQGLQVDVYEASFDRLRSARGPASKAFTLWLRRLPKPVGVFACNDVVGAELLDFAGGLGIAVPEQMAVVSVDNDDLFCDLCWPPLTSIIPDPVRAGYEAASLLERLMAGQRVPDEPIFISPLGIATRQSTDVLAVDDPDIALAMKFIRDYACDGIDVRDLLRHVPLSRRVLEKRFRDLLGRSPHEEILNVKLARAKQFLLETDLNLAAIAERTGFRHMEYLCVAFKRATGKTPGAFRRGEQRPPLQDGPRSEGDRRRT